jgi:hypothetical protein
VSGPKGRRTQGRNVDIPIRGDGDGGGSERVQEAWVREGVGPREGDVLITCGTAVASTKLTWALRSGLMGSRLVSQISKVRLAGYGWHKILSYPRLILNNFEFM